MAANTGLADLEYFVAAAFGIFLLVYVLKITTA